MDRNDVIWFGEDDIGLEFSESLKMMSFGLVKMTKDGNFQKSEIELVTICVKEA